MSVKNLKNLIHPVCNAAIQAGKIINKYYKTKIDISLKEDNSPLTQADLESNQVISNSLVKLMEGYTPVKPGDGPLLLNKNYRTLSKSQKKKFTKQAKKGYNPESEEKTLSGENAAKFIDKCQKLNNNRYRFR